MTNPGGATKLVLDALVAGQRTEWQSDVRSNLGALIAIGGSAADAVILANNNNELSAHGRAAAISRAVRKAHNETAEWAVLTRKLEARIKPIEERVLARVEVKPPTDPGERLAWELKAAEVRAQLRPLDETQRIAIGLQTQDPIVRYAIDSAPPIISVAHPGAMPKLVPFVSAEQMATVAVARARAAAPPELVEELESLVALKTMYETQLGILRRELDALAPGQGSEATAVEKLAAAGKPHA